MAIKRQFIINLTPNNFSQSLFSIENSPIFIFVFSLVLANKWHLSGLPLNKLSLNHLNKLLDAFSRESIKSLLLFADINGVLSSAKLAISTSFKTKNKSARNIYWVKIILNKNDLFPCKTFKLEKTTLKVFSTMKLQTKCQWFFVNQLFNTWTIYGCSNFCFNVLVPTRTLVIVRNSWKVLIFAYCCVCLILLAEILRLLI